jgi:hypothetical protein
MALGVLAMLREGVSCAEAMGETWRMAGKGKALRDEPPMITTAVHISTVDLALLRRVAVERANRGGGRLSVSDVLRSLIERHRRELEAEADRR